MSNMFFILPSTLTTVLGAMQYVISDMSNLPEVGFEHLVHSVEARAGDYYPLWIASLLVLLPMDGNKFGRESGTHQGENENSRENRLKTIFKISV